MRYTPTTWIDGETPVNAENLNKLESGVAAAVVSVNGKTPDENGNVEVAGGGGSGGAGADGFSPVASVTQTNSGAVITITDKGGTTTATVTNGKDGATGEKGDQGIQGETGAKGDKGDTGANGKDGVSATHRWNGTTLTITSASGTSSANLKGDKGDKGDTGAQGIQGATGATGAPGADGKDYTLTASDKVEIAEMVNGATIVQAPLYVESTDKMTDTSRVYVLAETGHIWAYMDTSVEKEVTVKDQIVGTTDNPYQVGRLSSSGSFGEATAGYVITPYIDLTQAKYAGKTIELHLDGNRYVSEANESYIQMAIFKTDKTVINGRTATCLDKSVAILPVLTNVTTKINGETSATLTIKIPASYNGTTIGYWRFCGKGTEAASNVYITYKEMQTVTGGQWVDTGTTYAPTLTAEEKQAMVDEVASMVDDQLLTMIGDGVVTV